MSFLIEDEDVFDDEENEDTCLEAADAALLLLLQVAELGTDELPFANGTDAKSSTVLDNACCFVK